MKTSLRILLTVLFLAILTPCHATDVVTIYDKFKQGTTAAPNPDYPQKCQHLGYQGQGIYRLVVNKSNGVVDEVKVMKTTGHRELDASAIMTFFNWKFTPGTVDHRDILVIFHLTGWTRGMY
jgi:TonB family protein